jgi:tetratricopeptide (TPR) repeat protein/HEAT repeat protein
MRLRAATLATLALLATSLVAPEPARAQFNPFGRKKPPAAGRGPRRPAPKAGSSPQGSTTEARDAAARSSATPPSPGTNALIERYFGVALSQPGAEFPLVRLAELYRERDGSIRALVERLEEVVQKAGAERLGALAALGGVLRLDGQLERATTLYEQAIRERPEDPRALVALAGLLVDRGEKQQARTRLEQALAQMKDRGEREQTLRTLLGLSLDLKDFDGAAKVHRELVKLARGSAFVAAELARELAARGELERAEVEYRAAVKASLGDARALGPALRDLGRVLTRAKKYDQARQTLREALRVAGHQPGLRHELYQMVAEVYRHEERIRELVQELAEQRPTDPAELKLLASLYEETGQVEQALGTYRSVLKRAPGDLDTRLKVVQLLQIQGALSEVVKEYEALVRAAPRSPEYVFQLAEALIQRGERARALGELKQLEARARGDEDMLAALVDFYERVGEKERATEILRRLSDLGLQDPRHVVELGDRYWQAGDKKKALATWLRLKSLGTDRALGLVTLGEVYLEHDLPVEALEALKQAVELKPQDVKVLRAYATALERTASGSAAAAGRRQRHDEARQVWEQLLVLGRNDPQLAREARQHIVTLFSLSGNLAARVGPLGRRLAQNPPDLAAGRLLGEVQLRLRDYPGAERTLRRVLESAKGDTGSLAALEHVLVLERKLREAIGVLKRLVLAEPKRAREYYQRMAQYALELYQDEEAIQYAARAVELSPDDAEGHRKLGQLYRRRQAIPKAMVEFRQAIAKNDRLFPVYFELAELLLGQGSDTEADQLLRRVVRACPDEELLAQAARLSMQINLGRGTLESLEKELLPVALGNPGRPLYRRLLIEIYGAMAFPWVLKARASDSEQAAAARSALVRIGERAVGPLLDALGDEQGEQQRTAIELLGHIANPSAGPALFAYATGTAPAELRVRAMLAAGALRDAALVAKLGELLAPSGVPRADEADPVMLAAAWSLAAMRKLEARPWLILLVKSEAPSLRALGALGLGWLRDARSRALLNALGRSSETGPLPRAAAAFALAEVGTKADTGTLVLLSEHPDPLVRAAALLGLTRLSPVEAKPLIAEALLSADPELTRAAASAAILVVNRQWKGPAGAEPVLAGRVDVRVLLGSLIPNGEDRPQDRVQALLELEPELARALVGNVHNSPDRARSLADRLELRDHRVGLEPLSADVADLDPSLAARVRRTQGALRSALIPGMIALASHPSSDVRGLAVRFLGTCSAPEAQQTVFLALSDDQDQVQRVALDALAIRPSREAARAVARLLAAATSWSVRLGAAQTLGRLGLHASAEDTLEILVQTARKDPFSLVREAALKALPSISAVKARPVLEEAVARDPEPRVRTAALAELGKL